jgi:P27 family predicted phage terminase small subunit
MKGRKPIPSRIHELRGDPGKRHRNREGEPHPDALETSPRPPKHLNRRAAAVWRRTVPELIRMRVISKIDSSSLAAYCSAVATYEEADERLKTEPWTTTTARGGSRPNPLFKIRDDSLRLVNKFSAEFGLTPSNRARIKMVGSPKQSAFDRFLDLDQEDEPDEPAAGAANQGGVGDRSPERLN